MAESTVAPAVESARRTAFSLSIPRQHGAWSILLASYVLGVACVDAWSPASLVLLVAVVTGFAARHAAVTAVRMSRDDTRRLGVWAWTVVYAASVAAGMAVLLLAFDRWRLVPLGIAVAHFVGFSVALERKRLDRTLFGELLGTVGLTLVVPAAAYVSTGMLDVQTWALWFLATAFFAAAVFHVRYLIRNKAERAADLSTRLRAAAPSLAFHFGTVAACIGLAAMHHLPLLAPAALVPATIKAALAAATWRDTPIPVRRIGFTEVGHTIAFAVLAVVAYHL